MSLCLFYMSCLLDLLLNFVSGIYVCSKCDYPLFSSHAKYEHQTPWPAFTTPLRPDSLSKKPELEHQESSQCTALKVCPPPSNSRSIIANCVLSKFLNRFLVVNVETLWGTSLSEMGPIKKVCKLMLKLAISIVFFV